MYTQLLSFWIVIAGLVMAGLGLGFAGGKAQAEVTSDGTLSTTITQSGNTFTIDQGDRVGNNLFHSFGQFSVPTGGAARFNNAADVQNIFSRVTGGSVSNIDGIIQANGTANLFLLNPRGILFGPNASLNIGGSLIGTTANSVQFADGIEFSAVNPTAAPLLTISVPIGLQIGPDPGAITVQGPGHRMTTRTFMAVDRSNNPIGLQVSAGNTLALIGGTVNFSGGIVGIKGGGHLELGSVRSGTVKLNLTGPGWVGDYSAVGQFNDIYLTNQSLLDASGSNGSIQIQGQNITLSDSSVALIQNLGATAFGGTTVQARGALTLTGNTPSGNLGSLIAIDNLGTGQTGDITISATQLSLQNGAQVRNRTFASALGGNILVNVADAIVINSLTPTNPTIASSINTQTVNSPQAGNITISTGSLTILNGGTINSTTVGLGKTGTLQIQAQDLIEIVGAPPITFLPSLIATITITAGKANDVWVNTSRLVIRDGGFLGSLTVNTGDSGSVTVNAADSIEVRGRAAGSITASRIASTAEIVDPATQAAFRLSPIPSGNAGALTINTPSLGISDGAIVTVKNDGPGSAGDLQINADSVRLDRQGNITASTASGNGGNLSLNLEDSLRLRRGSLISVTAAGRGNGGNITINSPIVAGFENSDILANASQGRGGNIQIVTQGIFGLKFRPQRTLENDITASSEFGVTGIVQVNTIGGDPGAGLVALPVNLTDSSRQIVAGCAVTQTNRFVVTGRGGIPENPSRGMRRDRPWQDLRDPIVSPASQLPTSLSFQPLTEVTTWQRNPDGEIELIALIPSPEMQLVSATCAPKATAN